MMSNNLSPNILDDPQTTRQRAQIIQNNLFLKKIYDEWYKNLIKNIPEGNILEIGSGAGFLKEYLPNLIASDILQCNNIDLVLDAQKLPFGDTTLDGIVMNNVLHHIPNVRFFFKEASRCLKANGIISLNEPWNSKWSKIIYKNFHHEPFNPETTTWSFETEGPLSSANGALPWILFSRDLYLFKQEFPEWHLISISIHMPFTYLLSGGFTMRNLAPASFYKFFRLAEKILTPLNKLTGMFAYIKLQKK